MANFTPPDYSCYLCRKQKIMGEIASVKRRSSKSFSDLKAQMERIRNGLVANELATGVYNIRRYKRAQQAYRNVLGTLPGAIVSTVQNR